MAVRETSCVLGDYLQKMKNMCVGKSLGEVFVLRIYRGWFARRGLLGLSCSCSGGEFLPA